MESNPVADLLGSLHPLIIHFPIAFILLALFAEWLSFRKSKIISESQLRWLWMVAGVAALVSAICGLCLASGGRYSGDHLFYHKWGSILLTFFTLIMACLRFGWIKMNRVMPAFSICIFLLLLLSGHQGGTLTHGKNHFKNFFKEPQYPENPYLREDLSKEDTLYFYEKLIEPILHQKCLSCHNESLDQAGLNLSTYVDLIDDTYGEVINPGDPMESQLVKRMTISPLSEKYMPPYGEPLNYFEIYLLQWWIRAGAEVSTNIREIDASELDKWVVYKLYNIDLNQTGPVVNLDLPELADSIVQQIKAAEFNLSFLGQDNPWVEVSRMGKPEEVTEQQMESLLPAKEYILWLDLSNTLISDRHLAIISEFNNLNRLKIQNTAITDSGLASLEKLTNLQSLNIYGTEISDQAIPHLAKLAKLKRLYIWNTHIGTDQQEYLKTRLPDLEIISGSVQ